MEGADGGLCEHVPGLRRPDNRHHKTTRRRRGATCDARAPLERNDPVANATSPPQSHAPERTGTDNGIPPHTMCQPAPHWGATTPPQTHKTDAHHAPRRMSTQGKCWVIAIFLRQTCAFLIINLYICTNRHVVRRAPAGTGHSRATNGRFPPIHAPHPVAGKHNEHPGNTNQNFYDMLTLRTAKHSCQLGGVKS